MARSLCTDLFSEEVEGQGSWSAPAFPSDAPIIAAFLIVTEASTKVSRPVGRSAIPFLHHARTAD